jgi:hypothetical protein
VGPRALLKKAISLSFCIKTTPIHVAQSSVSTTKGIVKSGIANTGVVVISFFKAWKACSAVVD